MYTSAGVAGRISRGKPRPGCVDSTGCRRRSRSGRNAEIVAVQLEEPQGHQALEVLEELKIEQLATRALVEKLLQLRERLWVNDPPPSPPVDASGDTRSSRRAAAQVSWKLGMATSMKFMSTGTVRKSLALSRESSWPASEALWCPLRRHPQPCVHSKRSWPAPRWV